MTPLPPAPAPAPAPAFAPEPAPPPLLHAPAVEGAGRIDRVVVRASPVVATVSVIADRSAWSEDLERYLSDEGFAVVVDPDGSSAFDHRTQIADVVIIDLQLAGRSGAAISIAWRRRSTAPILAIARSSDEAAILEGFAAGADHVVVRDVTPRQLVARLRSLLRRVPPRRASASSRPVITSVRLGEDGRSAVVLGRTVRLTHEEYQILALLLDRGPRVVTRAELAGTVMDTSGGARGVDFVVRRLRGKLEDVDERRRIVVVRGVGFRFDIDGEDGACEVVDGPTAGGEGPT